MVRLIVLLSLFGLASSSSQAQFEAVPKATDVVKWRVALDGAGLVRGGSVDLVVRADVEEGWSSYAMGSPAGRPLSISFDTLPEGVAVARGPEQSGAERAYDPNFDSDVMYFRSSSEVRFGLDVKADAPLGEQTLGLTITFMACSDRLCLPPTSVPFHLDATVDQSGS